MIQRRAIIASVVIAATLATLALPISRLLVWNITASVPTGLYWIRDKPNRYVGELAIAPAEHSDAENAPDYRVIIGDGEGTREVGAGWKKVGEKAGAYVALQIDDPSFVQPLRANLFRAEHGNHVLLWSRASRRDEKS